MSVLSSATAAHLLLELFYLLLHLLDLGLLQNRLPALKPGYEELVNLPSLLNLSSVGEDVGGVDISLQVD
ncbi:MAG: hypothetical protein PHN90_05545 [Methanothrix sp.]|jgi:hypothetical protein|nr:hypothetical protein [Methanothrix sp.]